MIERFRIHHDKRPGWVDVMGTRVKGAHPNYSWMVTLHITTICAWCRTNNATLLDPNGKDVSGKLSEVR